MRGNSIRVYAGDKSSSAKDHCNGPSSDGQKDRCGLGSLTFGNITADDFSRDLTYGADIVTINRR